MPKLQLNFVEYHFPTTEREQEAAYGSSFTEYFKYDDGKYYNGISMFHSLHCIVSVFKGGQLHLTTHFVQNLIRMVLDKDNYSDILAQMEILERGVHTSKFPTHESSPWHG